jgi:two-component system cell cycle sensor histidine kinase/response regulator CckA
MNDTLVEPNHRILVVDDNPAIHDDFRKILCHSQNASPALDEAEAALFGQLTFAAHPVSFEIDSAFQGSEGLGKVERALQDGKPYALAFVDVRMPPGWDGVETISRLWKSYPALQVVICTAYSDYSWDEIMRQLGPSDNMIILKKPFDNIEVLQLAHTLTQKWLLSEQKKSQMQALDGIVLARTRDLQEANVKLRHEIQVRTHAEEALRLSEERFEKAFKASPMPMAIQRLEDERYVDVNDAYLKMIEADRLEVIGHLPAELSSHFEGEVCVKIRKELQESKSVRNLECSLTVKSGPARQVLVFVELFNLGAEPHMLVITQDVSERVKLEDQLRQAQKMEAVGQLAAGVAHDFNNILTVIQGHVSLRLATANLDREIAESLKEVATAAERATRLTRQLLAFSRKQVMQRKLLNLNELIGNLSQMLRRMIGEHIDLRCVLDAALPSVYADASNLEQVIMNLAVNARDAMLEAGTLTLSTAVVEVDEERVRHNREARRGRFVCLSVADTGCGMDNATLRRIFEPFFTTKSVGKGTGMGLAMVYGILKQHGGWVEVHSQVGHGTTFDVFLPVNGTATHDASVGPPSKTTLAERDGSPPESISALGTHSPKLEASQHRTILVVEDEPALRFLVETILRKNGFRILVAENGVEALKVWEEQEGKVDLLLTDMIMPEGMSGRKLAERLRQENRHLKVIYSSGYSGELIDKEGLKLDGHNFLSKPYHPKKLLEVVRASLDVPEPVCKPG